MFRFLPAMFRSLSASKRPASRSRASFRPQLEGLEERALLSAAPLVTQFVPAIVSTQQVANQGQLTPPREIKLDLEKAIPGGPIQVRNGPVGSAPQTQREQELEALARMKAMPVTRPPADGIQPHEIRPRFLTGAETGERPATPPKGWRKIEVFGPPVGNSTIAVKTGTFYQDPATGRMIRWS
jgi:hypothetical protein